MTRNSLNFWIDIALLVAMAALIATGAIMQFLLPPGSGHFLMIFGMSRHGFGQIHAWLSVATVALIVVHIVLHWEWVCCLVGRSCGDPRPCRRTRVIWGASVLLLFVLLIGGGLWWAL
nr:DUF4405 domain-containing protein [bacterium]